MKKYFLLLFTAIGCFGIAWSQDKRIKDVPGSVSVIDAKTLLEVGVDVHSAIGNLKDLYGAGVGVNVGIKRQFNSNVAGIIRGGYTNLFGKEIPGPSSDNYPNKSLIRALSEIEVVSGPREALFGRGTGGVVFAKTKSSETNTSFMYGATGGYRFLMKDKFFLYTGLSYHNFGFNEERYGYLSIRVFINTPID